jgi:hypothetical protein
MSVISEQGMSNEWLRVMWLEHVLVFISAGPANHGGSDGQQFTHVSGCTPAFIIQESK